LTPCFLALIFIGAMASTGESEHPPARPSVFLSYAAEDRKAANSIRDAMVAGGIDVWYDENELGGGDAWDQKIRRQIRECDYFMALISARTEARHEGYFRREWRLAVERALDMADDHTFILPIALDDTGESTARVPEKFHEVQWLRVPGGQATPALATLCRKLISGNPTIKPGWVRPPPAAAAGAAAAAAAPNLIQAWAPPFPREEPGQRVKFWVHVAFWAVASAWAGLKRLPRWLRSLIYLWIILAFLGRGCWHGRDSKPTVSQETAQKLQGIADKYSAGRKKDDIVNLGQEIARAINQESGDDSTETKPLLAVPFSTAGASSAEAKIVDSTFALLYGQASVAHHGQVALGKEAMPLSDVSGAVELGRQSHGSFVLMGAVEGVEAARTLAVKAIKVADGSVSWSKVYPLQGADPAAIAADVQANIPPLDDH
jgi:hypothetical protein